DRQLAAVPARRRQRLHRRRGPVPRARRDSGERGAEENHVISDLGFWIRAVAVALVVTTVSISAQPQVRRATNIAALLAYPTFYIDPAGPWPRAGEVTAIIATSVTPAQPPPAPSIRAIVLNPDRYFDQKVTISGQFSGRNLMGDLPDAPAKSRYDFVLRAAD